MENAGFSSGHLDVNVSIQVQLSCKQPYMMLEILIYL